MSTAILEIDLHGKNTYQAKTALDVTLRRSPAGVYRIRVIHGSSRGTALRDMVWETYPHHPRVLRLKAVGPDITDLILREM
jgi:DNA-nicking Smr family endonuclease